MPKKGKSPKYTYACKGRYPHEHRLMKKKTTSQPTCSKCGNWMTRITGR